MQDTKSKKIYIIAGEPSGDNIGARLMEAIRQQSPDYVEFFGVGGNKMTGQGIKSLFPMRDISVMGFTEILPHIPRILKLINKTVEDILRVKPDIVVTIDSPGFNTRLAEKLQGKGIKLLHYVAPTVWAYKPERAEKFARLFNHMLLLLPFEKPYFDKTGLDCTYVGHPIVEDIKQKGEAQKFLQRHHIKPEEKILALTPGSRKGEVGRIMPVFCKAAALIKKQNSNVRVVVFTLPELRQQVEKFARNLLAEDTIIIDSPLEKKDAMAACHAAIAKSGTNALEFSLNNVALVVAYKVNPLTAFFLKRMIKTPYVNLINIVAGNEVVPELIQGNCTVKKLAEHGTRLLADGKTQSKQAQEVLKQLGLAEEETPSAKAARTVLRMVG